MNKMTSGAIRAESCSVVGAALFGFVLGVAVDRPQFTLSMSILALIVVPASLVQLKLLAHFGFVSFSMRHSLLNRRG